MKALVFVLFVVYSAAFCGRKPDIVDFTTACVGAPNRKVSVEGFIEDENPTCNSNSDLKECSFWMNDTDRVKAILFTLKAGKAANQVEMPEIDTALKAPLLLRGANGNVLDLKKKIILSGKTTLLVSSSMSPVCKIDDAEVSQ